LTAFTSAAGTPQRFAAAASSMVRAEALLPEMKAILMPLDRQARLFPAAPFLLDAG